MMLIRKSYILKSISGLILYTLLITLSACIAKVDVPAGVVIDQDSSQQIRLMDYTHEIAHQNINDDSIVTMPRAGEKNAYDIIVTPELEVAYDAYLGGDGELALKALSKAASSTNDKKFLWQVSFLKVKIHMMMGLSSDALEEVEKTAAYEISCSGTNLNSIALRGELKVWLEDYTAARKDFLMVLSALGDWELPTAYMGPPSNMAELISTTTAQLRSYTGMAALELLQGHHKQALHWAEQAEKRFNAIFYVSNHPVYGPFVKVHLDSYYGRAMNLAFLASSMTALHMKEKQNEAVYQQSLTFFDKIRYAKGKATVLALRANAYYQSGQHRKSHATAMQALEISLKHGILDFVWRIEAQRGNAFIQLGQRDEAEQAFRRAFNAMNYISGSLQSDISKRKFGIGKDDIIYQLVQFDLERGNLAGLFRDLEQSRARAFVDMLANRKLELKGSEKLIQIKHLDRLIAKQYLLNSGPGEFDAKGVIRHKKLLQQRQGLAKELRQEDAQLAGAVSIWTTELSQVQQKLQPGEALAYFLPTRPDEPIKLLYITGATARINTLAIDQRDLHQQLRQLRMALGLGSAGLSVRGAQPFTSQESSSTLRPVLQTAVDKFKKALHISGSDNISKLYIVPYANVNFVPWALLDTRYAVSVLPNGSWLNIHQKAMEYKNIVIVGDPNFAGQLPQLPGARVEARALAKSYGTQALIFNDATLANIQKKIGGGAAILHLATHAVYYKESPMKSALFLTQNQKTYALTAEHLYSSPLSAELVVLSACETGMGESQGDSDFLGLSRGFYLSGSKAILNTLWPVDDEGTKQFMLEFHRFARIGEYTKGWLYARDVLKSKAYSPAVYGAFVLHGVDRSRE